MSEKVVLHKKLLENIPSEDGSASHQRQSDLNELVDIERIWLGLAERIARGYKIKSLAGRIKYYELLRIEVLNQSSDTTFYISPLLSRKNNESITAINKYVVKHLDIKIDLLNQEKQIRSNPARNGDGLISNQNLPPSILNLAAKADDVSEEVHPPGYPQESLMSRKEVAKFFSVTPVTITTWMKEGRLPFLRVKRRVYFKKEEILFAAQTKLLAKQSYKLR